MSEVAEYTGSCLCGQVAYNVVGKADRFFHCHCQRCRKATGTGHASNLLLPEVESAKFTRGESELSHYRVPEAKRFSTCFCRHCGSNMPRILSELNLVIIPAGSLDHEPELQPQARIFADSKASWSCTDTELPAFERYPG